LLSIAFSLLVLAVLVGVSYLVTRPSGAIITDAAFSLETITPNADGQTDAAVISYRIRRTAELSIYFEGEDGHRYTFRTRELRARGEYEVVFSGIVDGYVNEGEEPGGEVVRRLVPDGEYTWVVEASDPETGRVDRQTGSLTVADADPVLPDLWEFSISPEVFTPNQDGLDDLMWVNVYVPKPATVHVYLIDQEGQQFYVPEAQLAPRPGEGGRHTFRYDGGIDVGRNPPPDGTYEVLVEALDDEGQRVRQRGSITIAFGGMPLAEVVAQPVGDTVYFSSQSVVLGDVLWFELTVENYGNSPIRTSGPAPGYVYEQGQTYASSGYNEESGAWRVGIHCSTAQIEYPWRWGLAAPEDLTIYEINGIERYYLMPGERAVVSGGIRMANIIDARNPQECWAGLIHEDVGIAPLNNRVDPHWITLLPDEGGGG
jgi:hypothetical protein